MRMMNDELYYSYTEKKMLLNQKHFFSKAHCKKKVLIQVLKSANFKM